MGTTEQNINIKMCEKAKEIQEAWKPKTGDHFVRAKEYFRTDPFVLGSNWAYTGGKIRLYPFAEGTEYLFEAKPSDLVWLPLQHQLQEILLKDLHQISTFDMLKDFWVFVAGFHYIPYVGFMVKAVNVFNSMEQLWLAFVMHEKCNKVWDGEDWIEEG